MINAIFPYRKKRQRVFDLEMAYVGVGAGDPIVTTYGQWLSQSTIPKLFVNCEPGVMPSTHTDFCRAWPAQTEITVSGRHYPQEDSPAEIGVALTTWLKGLA